MLLVLAGATTAHADGLRRTVMPMTRADGDVCDLLRSEIKDRCKPVAQLGNATVYESGSKAAGVRRTVLAIQTDAGVLVGPAVDVLIDARTTPQLQSISLDGRPGFALDVTASWKHATEQQESLVGCAQSDAGLWKCALIDAGTCDATLDATGAVTTSCGTKALLSLR